MDETEIRNVEGAKLDLFVLEEFCEWERYSKSIGRRMDGRTRFSEYVRSFRMDDLLFEGWPHNPYECSVSSPMKVSSKWKYTKSLLDVLRKGPIEQLSFDGPPTFIPYITTAPFDEPVSGETIPLATARTAAVLAINGVTLSNVRDE